MMTQETIQPHQCGSENIHVVDRLLRFIVGITLLLPVFPGYFSFGGGIDQKLALLAIYPLLTAICEWDPVYELLGLSTKTESSRVITAAENTFEESAAARTKNVDCRKTTA